MTLAFFIILETKVMNLLKLGNPKFPQNLRTISRLSTTGKPFAKITLKIGQRDTEENSILNSYSYGFRALYSTYEPRDL
jgi:hypothetical protein